MPPSPISGMSVPLSACATSLMAVICGTPTPATTRVVQIEPGPMPTLTASAPASTSARAAAAVAMLPAMTSSLRILALDLPHAVDDAARMAVGGVDHDDVDAGLHQALEPLVAVAADADGGAGAQLAGGVLGGVGMLGRLEDVLDGHQAAQLERRVHHQHALEPVLVHQRLGFVEARAFAHRDQPFARRHDASTGASSRVSKRRSRLVTMPTTVLPSHHRQPGDAVLAGDGDHFADGHVRA